MNPPFSIFGILMVLALSTDASDYEVRIERGPATAPGSNTFRIDSMFLDNTPLLRCLGGETNITRVLVQTPFINADQQKLTADSLRVRFARARKMDSKSKDWHYAPFTIGAIYLRDGRRVSFQMYLSGIHVGTNLFVESP
jgi:hypothetical protein